MISPRVHARTCWIAWRGRLSHGCTASKRCSTCSAHSAAHSANSRWSASVNEPPRRMVINRGSRSAGRITTRLYGDAARHSFGPPTPLAARGGQSGVHMWTLGPGVVTLPDGRLVRGRALRSRAVSERPDHGACLLGSDPGTFGWSSRWVRWRDFRTPSDRVDALDADLLPGGRARPEPARTCRRSDHRFDGQRDRGGLQGRRRRTDHRDAGLLRLHRSRHPSRGGVGRHRVARPQGRPDRRRKGGHLSRTVELGGGGHSGPRPQLEREAVIDGCRADGRVTGSSGRRRSSSATPAHASPERPSRPLWRRAGDRPT